MSDEYKYWVENLVAANRCPDDVPRPIERAHAPIETKLPDPLYLALGITARSYA